MNKLEGKRNWWSKKEHEVTMRKETIGVYKVFAKGKAAMYVCVCVCVWERERERERKRERGEEKERATEWLNSITKIF